MGRGLAGKYEIKQLYIYTHSCKLAQKELHSKEVRRERQ